MYIYVRHGGGPCPIPKAKWTLQNEKHLLAHLGNTIIGPTGEAYFTHGRVFQGTDGTLCHTTRNAIICN